MTTNEPTEQDQARAQHIAGCKPYRARVECEWDFTYCTTHDEDGNPRWGDCRWAAVAQELADERARTRSRFLQLANEYERNAELMKVSVGDDLIARWQAFEDAAESIRRVAWMEP